MSRTAPSLLAVLAAVLLLTTPAQAARRCPRGTVTWRLDGKPGCAPSPAAGRAPSAPLGATLAAGMVRGALRTPHSRLRPPRRLARALPALATRAATLATHAGAPWHRARASADRGNVVDTLDEDLKTMTLDDGTTVTARSHATAFEDGSKSVELQLEAARDGYTVRVAPAIDDLLTERPKVGCPTADGRVELHAETTMGNTITALHGRTVMGAATERSHLSTDTVGHVGPDAHLDDAVVKVTFTHRHAERGIQLDATVTATIDVQRSGAATLEGTPSMDVKIRVVGASAREERAAERDYAAQAASDPDLQASLRKDAAGARGELADAEPVWYDLPNNCAEVHYDPVAGAELAPGQDLPVRARITTRDGEPATGTLAVQSVPLGGFSLVSGAFDPATQARFSAHGAQPNDDGTTALATVIGASTAGRADLSWSGHHDPVKLPERLTGTLALRSLIPGASSDDWAGTATYTLRDRFPKADGSVSATYALTDGSLSRATSTIAGTGQGCRLQASGTGGEVADGDLELRVAADGTATYALLYDVEIPSVFQPFDCQPGQAPPPLSVPIVGMVDSHLAGSPPHESFRPVEAGWHLSATDTPDVAAAPGATVAASWDLRP